MSMSHLPMPWLTGATIHDVDDMAERRERRNRWRRVPRGSATAALSSTDPEPFTTLIRRTDEEVARITALLEGFAQIGRVPPAEDLIALAAPRPEDDPPPLPDPDPDPFSEGALSLMRYLRGELDEVSFLLNWAGETP